MNMEIQNRMKRISSVDNEDLVGTLTNITDEIKKLPQKHSELWDIFKTITNKRDAEAYQVLLKDVAIRVLFYDKLAAFAKGLKLALSSIQFYKEVAEKTINRYKTDLTMFIKLRLAVIERYSDVIDYKQYEAQYLNKVKDIMDSVLFHTDTDIPEAFRERDIAKAFYGLSVESLQNKIQDNVVRREISTQTALSIDDMIQNAVLDHGNPIIDWQYKTNITGKLQIEIGVPPISVQVVPGISVELVPLDCRRACKIVYYKAQNLQHEPK